MNDKFRVLIVSFCSFVVKRTDNQKQKMELHHTAIWVNDLEKIKVYYIQFFHATSNNKYTNPDTGFASYFLSFESGSKLEIMYRTDIPDNANDTIKQYKGYIHLAFCVDSREEVEAKAKELQEAGYPILRGPRLTGDGYYEFETLDPEWNRLEVMSNK
jgi:lactoylglutathione lyase